jgi:hypothetical protein
MDSMTDTSKASKATNEPAAALVATIDAALHLLTPEERRDAVTALFELRQENAGLRARIARLEPVLRLPQDIDEEEYPA